MQEKTSAYEVERAANIARNRTLLEQLGLKDTSVSLGVPLKPLPKPRAKPGKQVKQTKHASTTKTTEPRRQSARLQRHTIDANETPAQKRKREGEEEERRQKEEEVRLKEEEEEREAKRPREHDLDLAVLTEDKELGDKEMNALRGAFRSATSVPFPNRIGNVGDWVFETTDKVEKEVDNLKEMLRDMRIVARATVTEGRVYSAAYHPEPSKDLIFFGDKNGELGIWDATASPDEDGRDDGKCWRLQQHWPADSHPAISCIKFDPVDSHSVLTTSYDHTIRRFSLVSSISQQIFSSDVLIHSIDLSPTGREMWISDGTGGLTHYDFREGEKGAKRFELSTQKIGTVSVNPSSPHLLVTVSNNHFLSLWDTRKLRALVHEPDTKPVTTKSITRSSGPLVHPTPSRSVYDRDAIQGFLGTQGGKGFLRAEFEHGKAISSGYWDPRGRSIVSTSYDDRLRLWELDAAKYDSSPLFPSFNPFKQIRHNCRCGKWVSVLRATWNPNPDVYPHFTIAGMDRSLLVFSCKGDQIAKLFDASVTSVPAVTCSHPSIAARYATGATNGKCILWAPSDI